MSLIQIKVSTKSFEIFFFNYKMVAVHPMQNNFKSNINSDDIDVVILFND